jgi:hypothetical protein
MPLVSRMITTTRMREKIVRELRVVALWSRTRVQFSIFG